jgi:hypothetical protein
MATRDPYFDDGLMPERQALLWVAAVRRQLERWEPLVAKFTLVGLEPNLSPPPEIPTVMPAGEIWQGETERHLLLVATRNLLFSVALMDNPPKVDPVVAKELVEVRDLNEHWDENMPVFQSSPRPRDPKFRSGKDFAGRNPQHGPYCWWAWSSQDGPRVTPNVSATQVHDLVDSTINAARITQPEMANTVEDAAPRPWHIPAKAGDWWYPKLD